MTDHVDLVVRRSLLEDVGFIRARIDQSTRDALRISTGDIIKIEGKKITGAKAFRLSTDEEDIGIIRIDPLVRQNSKVRVGEKIKVSRADPKPAEAIVLAPIIAENLKLGYEEGMEDYVRSALTGRPIVEGDRVSVHGLVLPNKEKVLFRVIKAGSSNGIFKVTSETMIEMLEEDIMVK